MKIYFKILALAGLLAVSVSCKKDTVVTEPEPMPVAPVTPATGQTGMNLVFKNIVGGAGLVMGNNYVNATGETFVVSKFNYYIGKLVLTKTDNTTFELNDFYQIVKQSDEASRTVSLTGIPAGTYRSVKFTVGVDSVANSSGVKSGGLDPVYASDMYWGWSGGYISLKFEGTSPQSSRPDKLIEYHIGGYKGANKTQRTILIDFGITTANVAAGKTCTVNLNTDVTELFKSPAAISFSTMPTVITEGASAKTMADNYSDMITFGSVQNP
jgi:hypothetical protein